MEKDPKVTLQRKCKRDEEMIDEALRALVFTLVRLIGQLEEDNFAMFKYFLAAVQACTQNLKHQLVYLVKIEALLKFLHRVLDTEFSFNFKGFDDTVLNFSLRILVCEIFFHMKSEQKLFKMRNVNNSMKLLIDFLHQTLKMNIE